MLKYLFSDKSRSHLNVYFMELTHGKLHTSDMKEYSRQDAIKMITEEEKGTGILVPLLYWVTLDYLRTLKPGPYHLIQKMTE